MNASTQAPSANSFHSREITMDMLKGVSDCEAGDSYWAQLVAKTAPKEIAAMMLADSKNLDAGYSASPLAMHLPKADTKLAMDIADYLTPATDLDKDLKRFLYDKVLSRLREANQGGDDCKEPLLPPDNYVLAAEMAPGLQNISRMPRIERNMPPEENSKLLKDVALAITAVPSDEEVEAALKVLDYMLTSTEISTESLVQIQGTRETIAQHFSPDASGEPDSQQTLEKNQTEQGISTAVSSWDIDVRKYHLFRPPIRQKVCYICRFVLKDPHPVYKSMCRPCGAFNYAGNAISSPNSLKLAGKIALVTGARVNLGYRTALRLLRCGARVIATTRYPNDAAVRYSQEPDFEEWKDRLKVIGADFRTARDAFGLVKAVQIALKEWGVDKLHILINNAAQTLTDSVKKEERAIVREQEQSQEAATTKVVQQTHYQPRVRGGVTPLALYGGEGENEKHKLTLLLEEKSAMDQVPEISLPDNVKDDGRSELTEPYFKSSWVQVLDEIPYEDIISAHAVNAFVPLILCRELLPLMGELKHNRSAPASPNTKHDTPSPSPSEPDSSKNKTATRKAANRPNHLPSKPLGYIINISSREGLFETSPTKPAKRGHHVHTNMTKAAINMIVQTEASSAWESRRVCMNTVDPGYMSAAPEMDRIFDGQRPLDWEDGVGRTLWPVAVGEVQGRPVWGRFLKHFGGVSLGDAVER
ncbi:3-oxoacyl-reductase 4 [Naviculisporaceae sp. PSN 640]